MAISFLPRPGLPTCPKRLPILSVQMRSNAPVNFISLRILAMTAFSSADSEGMAIISRRKRTICFLYFLAAACKGFDFFIVGLI